MYVVISTNTFKYFCYLGEGLPGPPGRPGSFVPTSGSYFHLILKFLFHAIPNIIATILEQLL